MTKERLNWRSFADKGDINQKWNFPPTPAFYVIDQEGTIRHKWIGSPGKKNMDAALEKLMHETEASTPRK